VDPALSLVRNPFTPGIAMIRASAAAIAAVVATAAAAQA
jgi:hypothetical protein